MRDVASLISLEMPDQEFWETYQKLALRSESPQQVEGVDRNLWRLLHATMGLAGEITELEDAIAKYTAASLQGNASEAEAAEIDGELGDMQWFCALGFDATGQRLRIEEAEEVAVAIPLNEAMSKLRSEIGVLVDQVKRNLFYQDPSGIHSHRKDCVAEDTLAQIFYYVRVLAREGAWLWDQTEESSRKPGGDRIAAIQNIAKLLKRYPAKFTEDAALNRDTDAEFDAIRQAAKDARIPEELGLLGSGFAIIDDPQAITNPGTKARALEVAKSLIIDGPSGRDGFGPIEAPRKPTPNCRCEWHIGPDLMSQTLFTRENTSEAGKPIRVFDAFGTEVDGAMECDAKTGRCLMLLRGVGGRYFQTPAGNLLNVEVYLAAPLIVIPANPKPEPSADCCGPADVLPAAATPDVMAGECPQTELSEMDLSKLRWGMAVGHTPPNVLSAKDQEELQAAITLISDTVNKLRRIAR